MPLKVWLDLAHQDQVHQDLEQDLRVEHPQDLEQDLPVQAVLVQDLVEQSQDLVEDLLQEDSQVEDLLVVAVAASAEELPVPSVRAELAEAERLASQSVPREKNSNKEVFQALVAQLCHAVMARQLFVCAVVLRFKISQTRLMPMPVN
jgi:Fe2+ transport system protein B